jgi:hypothetical protein
LADQLLDSLSTGASSLTGAVGTGDDEGDRLLCNKRVDADGLRGGSSALAGHNGGVWAGNNAQGPGSSMFGPNGTKDRNHLQYGDNSGKHDGAWAKERELALAYPLASLNGHSISPSDGHLGALSSKHVPGEAAWLNKYLGSGSMPHLCVPVLSPVHTGKIRSQGKAGRSVGQLSPAWKPPPAPAKKLTVQTLGFAEEEPKQLTRNPKAGRNLPVVTRSQPPTQVSLGNANSALAQITSGAHMMSPVKGAPGRRQLKPSPLTRALVGAKRGRKRGPTMPRLKRSLFDV